MFEAVIRLLIGLCLVVLAFFIITWVFGELGIVLPAMVLKICWVILILVCVLIAYRVLKPAAGGWIP